MRRAIAACVVSGAAACALASPAASQPVYGVAGGNLVTFDTQTPGTIDASVPISGLQPAETIVGIDYQPETSEPEALFGVGSTSRLYEINPANGAATAIDGPFTPALSGTSFGVETAFGDYLRVVSDGDQSLRLDQAGTATADDPLFFEPGDPNEGDDPSVSGIALGGGGFDTLYGIDYANDVLVLIQRPEEPLSDGALETIGSLGVNTLPGVGFDVSPGGNPWVVLAPAGISTLYRIDLGSGQTTLAGTVGATITGGIAIPMSEAEFQATPPSTAFGEQPVGTIGPAHELTIELSGGDAAGIEDVGLDGANPDDFLITTDTCTFAVLHLPGDGCVVRLRFAPGGTGVRSAVLELHKPACCPSELFSYPLTGTGGPAPAGPPGEPGPPGQDRNLLAAALGLDRYSVRRRRSLRIRYVATLAATVTVEVRRRSRVVRRKSAQARPGRNRVRIRAPRKPGRYTLRLSAAADGQTTTDSARLRVTR